MLTLSDKFKNDTHGAVTNIHPVVRIDTEPPIYLSQNDEVIDGNHYKALNLKVPSIKESIDLESRNLKINNITLTISNKDKFSDKFATISFLDKFVYIYWKSQSCTTLGDCLQVYKAVIKRVDHDYNTVKFILEDLTQSIIHKDVPINVVDNTIAVSDKYKNVVAPMVYGSVDKAPCILYSQNNGISSNSYFKYIYASPDSPDVPLQSVTNTEFTGHSTGTSAGNARNTPLHIFTGRYLNVMETYEWYGDGNSTYNYPTKTQFTISNSYIGKCRFYEKYTQEIPQNPIADNVMQVTVLRLGKTASLIDNDSGSLNYLGSSDDIYIENEENLIDSDKYIYDDDLQEFEDTYATIPDSSLNSIDTFEADDEGFIPLTTFKNGLSFSGLSSNNPYPLTSHGGDYGWWDPSFSGRTYRSTIHQLMYNLHEYPIEIVCLPDSKKIHEWASAYYEAYTPLGSLPGWTGNNQTSLWANILNWGVYDNQSSHWFTTMPYNLAWYNGIQYDWDRLYGNEVVIASYWDGSNSVWNDGSQNDGGWQGNWQPFPQMLFKLETNKELYYGGEILDEGQSGGHYDAYGWVVWENNYLGESFGLDYSNLPPCQTYTGDAIGTRYTVDFWKLMEDYGGYMHAENPDFDSAEHSDIPRFRINDLEQRTSGSGTWIANYNASWNGVAPNIYDNQGTHGGYTNPDVPNDEANFSMATNYIPFSDVKENYGVSNKEGMFNYIHSDTTNWYMNTKEEIVITNPYDMQYQIKIPKGTLIPYKVLEYYGSLESQSNFKGGFYPGDFFSYDANFLTIQAGATFGDEQRMGIVYTLEDHGISDMVSKDMGVTQPIIYAHVGAYTGQPDSNITDSGSLNLMFLQAAIDSDATMSDVVSTQASLTTQQVFNYGTNGVVMGNSYGSSSVLPSYTWSSPDDFNAAILRYALETSLSSLEFQFNTKINYLGVMHIVEIADVLKQDFYINTKGRNLDSVTGWSWGNSSVIIEHIIKKELEVNASLDTSWESTKASLATNWMLAFSQTDRVNSKKLIEDIAKSSPLIPLIKSNYKLAATMIQNTYNVADISEDNQTIKAIDVIKSSFTRTKIENVKTMVRVRYKKDYARGSYPEKTHFTDAYDFFGKGDGENGLPGGYKKTFYGLDPLNPGDSVLDIENDFIRRKNVANNLRDFLLAYYCNQHNIIKLRLPIKYVDLEVTDIVEFDKLINDVKCYGEDYTSNGVYRNGQYIFPYFMITSVNKSTSHVDIECEQMHNLNKISGIMSIGSGDVDRNGTYSDQSDLDELTAFLTGDRPYFTIGQIKNADIDSNGKVDDNDLALMQEMFDISVEEEEEEEEEMIGSDDFEHQTTLLGIDPTNDNLSTFNTPGYGFFLSPKTTYDLPTSSGYSIFESYSEGITEGVPYTYGENALADGWYMQVGSEVMMIAAITVFNENYWKIYTQRGMLGTTPSLHTAGETVTFWSSEPTEGVITEDGLED